MASIVGAACGYEVMEMNASDTRNKNSIDTQVWGAGIGDGCRNSGLPVLVYA